MTETIRQKAEATLAEVEEISAVILPEPTEANAIVSLKDADKPVGAEIKKRIRQVREVNGKFVASNN